MLKLFIFNHILPGIIGVPMYKQQITKLFKKPFYCGIISQSMLDGKMIESKHGKLILSKLFLNG